MRYTRNRLTADPTSTSAHQWSYDAAGEVTGTTLSGSEYMSSQYDAASELTSLLDGTSSCFPTGVPNCSTTTNWSLTLSYNANGDRTQQTDSLNTRTATYSYDQADRLTNWKNSTQSASYTYNGDGLRLSKTVVGKSSTTEAFVWDLADGLPLILQDAAVKYVTGPGGLPLEQVNSNAVLYYYQDQLGSTRALLDKGGHIQATYTYDAYGNLASSTGTVTNPFQYAGQYTDSESGLQYLRARYYDPSTAQFLTVEPLTDQTGQPYGYAGANPLNATDPSGLSPNNASPACHCGDNALQQWMSKNWLYVSLLAGGAAMVGVAIGGSTAIFLGAIAASVGLAQLYVDYLNGDQNLFVGDAATLVLSFVGQSLGFRALRTAWALMSLKGILEGFITSRNVVGEVMATWYGLALNVIKHGIETRSIYYAVTGLTIGVLTASSDACV